MRFRRLASPWLICYATPMTPWAPSLALLAVFGLAGENWNWHTALAPHFEIFHEKAFMPGGFSMGLERLHGRLRLDLAMFSPWMSGERLKLYLYKDQTSFMRGQFKPPSWSSGISMYEKRTVAVYDQADRRKLMEVVSHETTHLLFESYWGEVGRRPPAWLNEGLAMVEEVDPQRQGRSDWFRLLVRLPETGYLTLEDVTRIKQTEELKNNRARVDTWYVESYSMVYFLLRGHSRLQFKNFCAKLRDGQPLERALWLSYRYASLQKFEQAWLAWLRSAEVKRALAGGSAAL